MAVTGGKNPKTTLLSSVLAVVILIVLIVAAIWGLLRIVAVLKPILSSFFSKPQVTSATAVPAPVIAQPVLPATGQSSGISTSIPHLPDLSVRILSGGVIDRITGDIVPRPVTSSNDLVAVSFDVANKGEAATGPWYFTARLPTLPPYTYASPEQRSLPPGAHIENTLRFTRAAPGGAFSVTTDPGNLVRESNENNNGVSERI